MGRSKSLSLSQRPNLARELASPLPQAFHKTRIDSLWWATEWSMTPWLVYGLTLLGQGDPLRRWGGPQWWDGLGSGRG